MTALINLPLTGSNDVIDLLALIKLGTRDSRDHEMDALVGTLRLGSTRQKVLIIVLVRSSCGAGSALGSRAIPSERLVR